MQIFKGKTGEMNKGAELVSSGQDNLEVYRFGSSLFLFANMDDGETTLKICLTSHDINRLHRAIEGYEI